MESMRLLLSHQIPFLDRDQEHDLIRQAQADPGGPAEERLVCAHLRLVVRYARRRVRRNPSLPVEDLIAAGLEGLLRAIRHFEVHRPGRLSTYAVPKIIQGIDRWIEDHGHIGKPATPSYLHGLYRRSQGDYGVATARNDEELLAAFNAAGYGDHAKLLLLTHHNREGQVLSIKPVNRGRSHNGFDIESLLPARPESDESDTLEQRSFTARALRRLHKRERDILIHHFGLDDEEHGPKRTLDQTGAHFGVSRERVRQVVKAALAKLRRWAEKEGFKCLSHPDESESSSPSTCPTAARAG